MALRNGFPAVSGAANFLDIRRDIAALVARDATGKIRAGVFPRHYNSLLTARADMKVDVAAFEAVLDRDGAVFLAHEGSTTVSIDAAPPANSRIDVIWVKQFETRAPFADATNGPQFGVLKGTAAASPVKPTALPAGALEVGTVQVPAGAVTTQSAGVILTTTVPYTATSGGTVPVRNSTELAGWVPVDGASAAMVSNGGTYLRINGAWAAAGPVSATFNSGDVIVGTGHANGVGPKAPPTPTLNAGQSSPRASEFFAPAGEGAITILQVGSYSGTYNASLQSASNARTFLDLSVGAYGARESMPRDEDKVSVSLPTFRVTTPNTIFNYSVYQGGGAREIRSQSVVLTYLGPLV